jgi:DNA modification methylase
MEDSGLKSRVLKTENINWRELKFIQQPNFKDISKEDMHAIKLSLLSNSFAQPFYVWEDSDSSVYCLDGKHRTLALEELISEGKNVPYSLPATFIHCENKKEAAKLVIIYSSIYAKVSQQGLFDFLKEYELQMSDLKGEISLPEFSLPRFEQKFDLFGSEEMETDDITLDENDNEPLIVNKGDIFELNQHRIICGSFEYPEVVELLMNGEKARIVNTDPPYNLAADYIGNVEKKVHTNFAMGHGEMTDTEFCEFLAKIMKVSCDNSIDGAIHFVFMDFRHSWHMGEASRKVYGSPEPKQMAVWAKDMMALGSFYRAQHELCFIYKYGTEKHISNLELMDRVRSNVWKYPSAVSVANPDRHEIQNHPTPKPVAMIADCILDTTNERDIVVDWFLGSGTTLIACEKTNRVFRGTEIEPKYIQLIIKRYISYCQKNGKEVRFTHLNGCLTINDFDNGK